MKKLFSLAAALFLALGLYAADKTFALTAMTITDGVFSWSSNDEVKAKNYGKLYVEVPNANTTGMFTVYGTSNNANRYLYVYGNHGTVQDNNRGIQMMANGASVDFAAEDLAEVDGQYYLVLGTTLDFKFKRFSYTIDMADHSKATVKRILVDGTSLPEFDADTLTYSVVLEYGTTIIPVVSAVGGDDATIVVHQATALPGAATVTCTSQDGTTSVTYTINFSVIGTPSSDASLERIKMDGKTLTPFDPEELDLYFRMNYDSDLTYLPTIAAVANESHATVVITQLTAIPGTATIVVTAQDGVTQRTYTLHFEVETEIPIIRAIHPGSGSGGVHISGSIGGTVKMNLQNNGKLGSDGQYFGFSLSDGDFLEGDSLVIHASALNGGNIATLFTDKEGTNPIASPEFLGDANGGSCVYILTANVQSIYIVRTSSACNPTLSCMEVFRPVDDGQPKLRTNVGEIDLNVTAERPSVSVTIVFSGKHLAPGTYNLSLPTVDGLSFDATSVTVGANGKLNALVTATYTTDVDVEAASAVVSLTIGALTTSVTVNYSATQAWNYMTGAIYIDQEILNNGTSFDIATALTNANINFADINSLDSLNDDKAERNLPYLGLKFKKQGAYIAGWLKAGDKIRLRFGYVGDSIKVSINGNSEFWKPSNNALGDKEYTAPADCYVELETVSGKTVIIKQIAINANLKDDIVLPPQTKYKVTCETASHGSVKIGSKREAYVAIGETVTLTVAPAEGYEIASVTVNGEILYPIGNEYRFGMPSWDVTVVATFVASSGTACENVQSEVIIRKYIRGGQLVIEKDGVLYTATGQRL